MKIGVFSAQGYDIHFLNMENKQFNHELVYFSDALNQTTAV